jgi:hypothetical protein
VSEKTIRATLRPRRDDWNELTELLEDLQAYTPASMADLYPVVQAIAEGKEATMNVYSKESNEFMMHMREFKIDVTLAGA